MVTVPARWARQFRTGHDAVGWSLLESADARIPPRQIRAWHIIGPHVGIDSAVAHGVYHRDEHGMRDIAVAADGWLLWRSRGPQMRPVHTPDGSLSSLVSHLNPLLAQNLHLGRCPPSVNVEPDEWTADAITRGLKTGGYFSLGKTGNRVWHDRADRAGIAVAAAKRYRYLHAAQDSTLAGAFDLDMLATDYARVLPPPLAEEATRALASHGKLRLIDACRDHEQYHPAITGLALGYPPDTTAGSLLPRGHRKRHIPLGGEHGVYCPRCDN